MSSEGIQSCPVEFILCQSIRFVYIFCRKCTIGQTLFSLHARVVHIKWARLPLDDVVVWLSLAWFLFLFQHFLRGDDIICNNLEHEFVSTVYRSLSEKHTKLRVLEQVFCKPIDFSRSFAEICYTGERWAWWAIEIEVERVWNQDSSAQGEGIAFGELNDTGEFKSFNLGWSCLYGIQIHIPRKRSWRIVHKCQLSKHRYLHWISEAKGTLKLWLLTSFALAENDALQDRRDELHADLVNLQNMMRASDDLNQVQEVRQISFCYACGAVQCQDFLRGTYHFSPNIAWPNRRMATVLLSDILGHFNYDTQILNQVYSLSRGI